jgi:hypothetical protein
VSAAVKARGRTGQATARKKTAARTAAAPYVLGYGTALAAAFVLGVVLGLPYLPPLPALVLGAALGHAGIRLHEAHGWHRGGGKAAARQRRRYQGHATMAELHRKLGLAAARRNAAIMRPSLGGRTRTLPPGEAGVLIGTARRWHR